MTALVVAWSFRAAVVVVFAYLVTLGLRRSSAASRNFVWRATLAVVVVIPAILLISPRIEVPVSTRPGITRVMLVPDNPVLVETKPATRETPQALAKAAAVEAALSPDRDMFKPLDYLIGIYFVGVLLSLLRWGASYARVRAMQRAAWVEPEEKGVYVVKDAALSVPVTFGWLKQVILLPESSNEWSTERMATALLHERAHMKRQDWIWQSASQWIAAFHWFNPLVWVLVASLRNTAEEAADDEVLAQGVAPSLYAAELLHFASASNTPAATAFSPTKP